MSFRNDRRLRNADIRYKPITIKQRHFHITLTNIATLSNKNISAKKLPVALVVEVKSLQKLD